MAPTGRVRLALTLVGYNQPNAYLDELALIPASLGNHLNIGNLNY